jgi:hypothetical protein
MNAAPDTIRVVIPLSIRRRNGRPRILPPYNIDSTDTGPAQDPHVVRALARAWSWRRKLENGEITTIQDIATAEQISDRYVSRVLRLAYLAPTVLEQLLVNRHTGGGRGTRIQHSLADLRRSFSLRFELPRWGARLTSCRSKFWNCPKVTLSCRGPNAAMYQKQKLALLLPPQF